MSGDSGVEVVIRKKSTFPPFGSRATSPVVPPVAGPITISGSSSLPSGSGVGPSGGARGFGKALKFLVLIILIIAVGFGAYKGLPVVTSFVTTLGGVDFSYTVTAKATETFTEQATEEVEFVDKSGSKIVSFDSPSTVKVFLSNGDDLSEKGSFSVSKGDSLTIEYYDFADGGSYKVSLNGGKVYGDLSTTLSGIQVQYETLKEQSVERTAEQEGTSKVSKNGKEKQVAQITAAPAGEKEGGELSDVTYEVTIDNLNVQGFVRDGWLYVKYVEVAQAEGGESGGNASGE